MGGASRITVDRVPALAVSAPESLIGNLQENFPKVEEMVSIEKI
jgi:hypothetical protein